MLETETQNKMRNTIEIIYLIFDWKVESSRDVKYTLHISLPGTQGFHIANWYAMKFNGQWVSIADTWGMSAQYSVNCNSIIIITTF